MPKAAAAPNETRELLEDALHALEQTLLAIGQLKEPSDAVRALCPICKGLQPIQQCIAERRFEDARDVVKRGRERS